MDQNHPVQKEHLEEQLKWTKEQIRILDEMDFKLQEMKKIAEYVSEHQLSKIEIEGLNAKLNVLQTEYSHLERLYNPVLH